MSVFLKDRFCSGCGAAASETNRFCRSCGFEIEEPGADIDQLLFFPGREVESSQKKPDLIGCGIIIAIIGILAAIAMPNFRRPHEASHEKACYANMRVVLGAIEMYNMDNTSMLSYYGPDVEKVLISGQYLKSPISRPETGCILSGHGTPGDVRIVCPVHGTVESD
ncbi:MAG: hypothetical protein HQM09_06665 [Candidatus Riflebacteria bacterium]|nr:hypothetical protein [Candidatus Riflebacteria bacterium]